MDRKGDMRNMSLWFLSGRNSSSRLGLFKTHVQALKG